MGVCGCCTMCEYTPIAVRKGHGSETREPKGGVVYMEIPSTVLTCHPNANYYSRRFRQ